MKTLIEIEQSIQRLKQARGVNATSIKDLEEQNEVINVELEKLLVRKGELLAQDRMKQYWDTE